MRPKGDDWNNLGRRPIGDDTYKLIKDVGHKVLEENIFKVYVNEVGLGVGPILTPGK